MDLQCICVCVCFTCVVRCVSNTNSLAHKFSKKNPFIIKLFFFLFEVVKNLDNLMMM